MDKKDYEDEMEKEELIIPEELEKKAELRKSIEDEILNKRLTDMSPEDIGKLMVERMKKQTPQNVNVINQIKEIIAKVDFPETQKVYIENQIEKIEAEVKFPDIQKVSLSEKIIDKLITKFPSIQKIAGSVNVDNLPDVQKVSIDNPVEKVEVSGLDNLLKGRQLPTGSVDSQGNLQKESSPANRFLNVRITDGKKFLGEMFTSAFNATQRIFARTDGKAATATVGNDGSVWVNIKAGTISGADGAILDGVSSSIKATILDTPGEAYPGTANPQLVRPVGTTATSGIITDIPGAGYGGKVLVRGETSGASPRTLRTNSDGQLEVDIPDTTTTSGVMQQAILDKLFAAINTQNNPLRKLITYSGSLAIYIGEAATGTLKSATSWRIKKVTYSGSSAIDISWADGVGTFIKEWDERESYDYTLDS